MRGRAGFEIVPGMENEKRMISRPRRRFSAEEKARIVGLYEESGLRRAEFCRREGVSLFNLRGWLGRRGRSEGRSGEARFVEVEARGIAEAGRYRMGFGGEAWLEVEGGFDEREVRVLAGIVREAARC
jgi:transposase